MRSFIRQFVELAADRLALRGPIYEFGAYQVAGQEAISDLRGLFPGQRYIGCDMRPGPGVDRIEDLGDLTLATGCAQTVLCLDTLEHVFDLPRAWSELLRVLAPGGALLVSVPFDFHIHAHPDDYWRITPSALARLLQPLALSVVGWQGPEKTPHTVYALGFAAPAPPVRLAQVSRLIRDFQDVLRQSENAVPWPRWLKQQLLGPFRSRGERRRQVEFYKAEFLVQQNAAATVEDAVLDEVQGNSSRSLPLRRLGRLDR